MHVSRGGRGGEATELIPERTRGGGGPDEAGPGEAGRGERAELGMGVPPGTGPGRKRLSLVDGMDLGESSFLCPSALVSLKEMCFRHFPLPALTPGQK